MSLPIWQSCRVGNEPGSGGSLPYLETPPLTVATIVRCPESRWNILLGEPSWQLLHEYVDDQLLISAIPMVACYADDPGKSRRGFLRVAPFGLLIPTALARAAEVPVTAAFRAKVQTWLVNRGETRWNASLIGKATAAEAKTTRGLAKNIVKLLFFWPQQAIVNSGLE